jgi:hypothetical protein
MGYLVLLAELRYQPNATVHSRQCHSACRISNSAAGVPEVAYTTEGPQWGLRRAVRC